MHSKMFAEDRILYLESMLQRRNIEYLNLKKENEELVKKVILLEMSLKDKSIIETKEEQVEDKPKTKRGKNARAADTN